MKIGTLVINNDFKQNCPTDCIAADGSWHTKDIHPHLYEIFKDCKCVKPQPDLLTGIVDSDACVKGIFHLPNSHGKAWIVYKDSN